jgi:hypothetical protein
MWAPGAADIPLTWSIFDRLPVRRTFRFMPTRPNGKCTSASRKVEETAGWWLPAGPAGADRGYQSWNACCRRRSSPASRVRIMRGASALDSARQQYRSPGLRRTGQPGNRQSRKPVSAGLPSAVVAAPRPGAGLRSWWGSGQEGARRAAVLTTLSVASAAYPIHRAPRGSAPGFAPLR